MDIEVIEDPREYLPNSTRFTTCRSGVSGMFQAFMGASAGKPTPTRLAQLARKRRVARAHHVGWPRYAGHPILHTYLRYLIQYYLGERTSKDKFALFGTSAMLDAYATFYPSVCLQRTWSR